MRWRGEGLFRLGAICKEYVGHSGGKVLEQRQSLHPYISFFFWFFPFQFLGGEEDLEEGVVGGRVGGDYTFLVHPVPVRQRSVRHPYFPVQP